jgi:dipeptidyl aminopeptidase/acylaminoacyl peptidase
VISASDTKPNAAQTAEADVRIGPKGETATIVLSKPGVSFSPRRLLVQQAGGSRDQCASELCLNVIDAWWLGGRSDLYFLRREGWAKSQTAMYHLRPGMAEPVRTFVTDDAVFGCVPRGERLLCAHEASTSPRKLVSLDPATGEKGVVYEPNPQVAAWSFGAVERLHWTSEGGTETYGDLVLPPGHKPGDRHPLIITSYTTRGFLRGGTGDEYPIQAFAARGYAVLSFSRPQDIGFKISLETGEHPELANVRGWADRKNVQSSLMRGIELLRDRDLIDMDRIGITGMSEGTAIVQWALRNAQIFAAAATSDCCDGPVGQMALQGLGAGPAWQSVGRPGLSENNDAFWEQIALEKNIAALHTPILMQLPEEEYLLTLPALATARELNKPIDAYVFPDEFHFKWQPSHRLAIYNRSLDWFDFWLKGTEDPDPSKAAQYQRWHKLREQRDAAVKQAP